jgi:LysW-gamma-L-lysine carboxypeptidase
MICAAGHAISEDFPGRLVVVGAVGEEGNSRGVRNLINMGLQADYAIFGEPSGVDNITIAYKGSLQIALKCRTKAGHSSAPWLFRNAAEEAFDLWKELKKIQFPEEKTDSRFYSLSSALTEINGGGRTSTIPSECELRANFRLPPPITPNRIIEEITHAVDAFHSSHPDVSIDFEVEDCSPAYEGDRTSVLVKGMVSAIRDVRKKTVTLLRKTGTGDMNLLGAALPIPMLTYGAGDSKLDHTNEENVNLDEYLDSIRILRKGLRKTLELHNNFKNRPHQQLKR